MYLQGGGWRGYDPAAGLATSTRHVAVAGGLVFVSGLEGQEGILRAYTLDGKPKWQASYGPEWHISHPGARSVPTVYEGLVYVASGVGNLVCLDTASGQPVWSVKFNAHVHAPGVHTPLDWKPAAIRAA